MLPLSEVNKQDLFFPFLGVEGVTKPELLKNELWYEKGGQPGPLNGNGKL